MGMKSASSRSYLHMLEKGELRNVQFMTVIRYLRACKAPIGKFMLELTQSGAFGEAEQGLTIATDDSSSSLNLRQEKRAKAKLRYQKRWEREARDSAIVAQLWSEVLPAIQPLLPPNDPSRRLLSPYLEGVRALYRAWKRVTRGIVGRDPTPALPPSPHPRGSAPEDGKPGAIRASFPVTPLGVEREVRMVFDRIEQAGVRLLVPAALHKMCEIVFDRLMAMIPQGGNT
jgi:hypothetical protein